MFFSVLLYSYLLYKKTDAYSISYLLFKNTVNIFKLDVLYIPITLVMLNVREVRMAMWIPFVCFCMMRTLSNLILKNLLVHL